MANLALKRTKPQPDIPDVWIPLEPTEGRRAQKLARSGAITRVAAGVYVNAVDPEKRASDELGPVALLTRRHWQFILGHIAPGAVISHLSAISSGITPGNEITLSHPTRFNTKVRLPGVTAVFLPGPGPLPGDFPLGTSGLYWSSRPRQLLENLGRVLKANPRTTGRAGVEEKLIEILNASGERALNAIRDEARALTDPLGAQDRFETLNQIIGALLGTYAKGSLVTRHGALVASGTPADKERLGRFTILADALRATPLPDLNDVAATDPSRTHFAFLESYFSNFVEGTRFSIKEAEEIALHNKIVQNRPKDSHDIQAVFQMILDSRYRAVLPTAVDILDGLRERHRQMLENRPEVSPGEFKTEVNFAGTTRFTEPAFVRGTLLEGVKLANSVPEGLPRAIYWAFLVSEIHPFSDGNGRLSRLLMNAELSRCGKCRIIIPTLFHDEYVDAQRALSRGDNPAPMIAALGYIAKWGTAFNYGNLEEVIDVMQRANSFQEDRREFKLLMPEQLARN
ncbi:Fic family protein [Uliginosibacterium sp. H3]|uniref:Fic family protein n=1 Tax=Uliginosibacterium silvisoli TaxID=3114758 RepID=A0ABU6K7E6_9RHOO|nr:Fic family protein [Uliginosibacterium sp. H3]